MQIHCTAAVCFEENFLIMNWFNAVVQHKLPVVHFMKVKALLFVYKFCFILSLADFTFMKVYIYFDTIRDTQVSRRYTGIEVLK